MDGEIWASEDEWTGKNLFAFYCPACDQHSSYVYQSPRAASFAVGLHVCTTKTAQKKLNAAAVKAMKKNGENYTPRRFPGKPEKGSLYMNIRKGELV